MKTLPSRLIKGRPLIGFMTAFDSSSGADNTPWPYKVVIPSAVGSALLPFPCPHCSRVADELVDPNKREDYFDKLRKFSWCPGCQKRFFVDRKGTPLTSKLDAGAKSAPAMIEEKTEGVGWGQPVVPWGGERQEIRGWRRPWAIPGHRRFMLGSARPDIDTSRPEVRAKMEEYARAHGDKGHWATDKFGFGQWSWYDDRGTMNSYPVSVMDQLYPGMSPLFNLGDVPLVDCIERGKQFRFMMLGAVPLLLQRRSYS